MSIADSLYFYFPLEEASGTRYNTLGSGNLTQGGTINNREGKLGNAAALSGSAATDFLYGADALSRGPEITISFWKYRDSNYTNWDVSQRGSSKVRWIFTTANSTEGFYVEGLGYITSDTPTNIEEWYHLVATFSDYTHIVQLWLNGNVVAEAYNPSTTLYIGTLTSFNLSRYGGGTPACAIDELAGWKRVLLPSEIVQLYNQGHGNFYNNDFGSTFDAEIATGTLLRT